jgi:hypothetical protein
MATMAVDSVFVLAEVGGSSNKKGQDNRCPGLDRFSHPERLPSRFPKPDSDDLQGDANGLKKL